jgi:peroxiredoxin
MSRTLPSSLQVRLFLQVALLVWSASAAASVTTGQPAPNLRVDAPGVGTLSDLRGQVVLVDFWASWCKPCAQSFPWLDSLHARLDGQGFTVLAVNVDKQRKKADAFLAAHPVRFPVAFDPAGVAAASWGLPGMPTSFLVDRKGVVRRVHTGFRPEEARETEALIRTLLAEPGPAPEGK